MNECDQLWAIERINLYFIEIHFLTGRFWPAAVVGGFGPLAAVCVVCVSHCYQNSS